jgi:Ca2+-binding RTX toxin-like protein
VRDDSYSTSIDQALHVAVPGVLGNDADAEGDLLSVSLVSGPSHGSLSLNSDGSFSYTPFLAFVGYDSFTYYANDGLQNSNLATANLTVNDGPNSFDFSTEANSSLNWTINLSGHPETAFNSKTGTQTLSGVDNVIAGSGNNTIIGNNDGDVLVGGTGNDTLKGGTGNDVIAGGNGTNTMTGGGGNNTFVFTPGSFKDTVVDFHPGNDVLDFQGFPGLTAQNLNSQILADVTSAHTAMTTMIQLAANEQVTLVGVTYNQLASSHPFEAIAG